MNRVVHFEIHAADPERTAAFYRVLFGWEIQEWRIPGAESPPDTRYWLVTTGTDPDAGIDGGLVVRRGPAPSDGQAVNAFVCTIGVASLDESLTKAVFGGGSVAVPKMPIKGVGWLAYAKDPAGNLFGMMQNDEHAV